MGLGFTAYTGHSNPTFEIAGSPRVIFWAVLKVHPEFLADLNYRNEAFWALMDASRRLRAKGGMNRGLRAAMRQVGA